VTKALTTPVDDNTIIFQYKFFPDGANIFSLPADQRLKWESSPAHLMVLEDVIEVSELAVGGPTRLSDEDIAGVRKAIAQGVTDGLPLKFKLDDPEDRLRIWMPDRLTRETLWITPWNIPGIKQPAGTLSAIASE
jgi:hypothetical protein